MGSERFLLGRTRRCAVARPTRPCRSDEILYLAGNTPDAASKDMRVHPERQFPQHLSKTLKLETAKSVHF
jgi:hypothetical protein